eukprot:11674469-Alexandrium_andersonii.AAC.1
MPCGADLMRGIVDAVLGLALAVVNVLVACLVEAPLPCVAFLTASGHVQQRQNTYISAQA